MEPTTKRPRHTGRRRTRALGVTGAVAAGLAVWAVADPVLGVELAVAPGGGETLSIGPGLVVVSSLVPALAGWALLALLERFTRRARAVWTAVALLALVGSMGGPLDATSTAATASLAAMHVAVAAVLVPVLATSAPATSPKGARS